MIKKITSKTGLVFLFNEIPNQQRNKLGIASGESILLTIYENDSYYFSTNINLIAYDAIIKTENPTPLEIDFFELLRNEEKRELKYKRTLVDKYEIDKYVHYLPKIKYTQNLLDGQIVIKGEIKYPQNSIHEKEVPSIILNDEIIEVTNDTHFQIVTSLEKVGSKIEFKMDLPKQIVTKPYKVKELK